MCNPVSAKNVPPNSGTPQGLSKGVTCSLWIRFSHSVRCSATKAAPPPMVARIQPTAAFGVPWIQAVPPQDHGKAVGEREKGHAVEKNKCGGKMNGGGPVGRGQPHV